MESISGLEPLAAVLRDFCADEVHHRADATDRLSQDEGLIARIWAHLIATGSTLGVRVARKI